MLISCGKCGKRYSVNDNRIPQGAVSVRCPYCEASVPLSASRLPEKKHKESELDETFREKSESAVERVFLKNTASFGGSIVFRLFMPFILVVLTVTSCILYSYFFSVPKLIEDQINQRAFALSRTLSSAISQPLVLRNYLAVNQSAALYAELPGVAYVSVQSRDGSLVTGLFGSMDRFDQNFARDVLARGFPVEIVHMNPIPEKATVSASNIIVGGRKIHDIGVAVRGNSGVVHVGLFMDDIDAAIMRSLRPLVAVIVLIFVAGAMGIWWVSSSLSRPLKKLTRTTEAIALGDFDKEVQIHGKGEIMDLALAVESMRIAIKSAITRLKNRQ
ncbi:HAMP domain-containing protein [Desulfobotulus mexicanus]|uniref:histidine kinase n=1 Tax=Desulfobotulus mexicanus TaxID=2586642 RepID=A0A5Q4VJN4_9BACT|nr:HAMP domain-containing protein [Desulfobotulus mexicanus]TYT76340.1 HAMP domain-containing protein [Desulfobotulus mexicanus]